MNFALDVPFLCVEGFYYGKALTRFFCFESIFSTLIGSTLDVESVSRLIYSLNVKKRVYHSCDILFFIKFPYRKLVLCPSSYGLIYRRSKGMEIDLLIFCRSRRSSVAWKRKCFDWKQSFPWGYNFFGVLFLVPLFFDFF